MFILPPSSTISTIGNKGNLDRYRHASQQTIRYEPPAKSVKMNMGKSTIFPNRAILVKESRLERLVNAAADDFE